MVACWSMPTSFDPPMVAVSISPERYTHSLIEESKAFTLAVVTKDIAEDALYLGHHSGRDGDKFGEVGLTPARSEHVDAPVIREAIANIECELVDKFETGDHTVFVGLVKHVLVDESREDAEGLRPTELLYWRASESLEDTWTLEPKS